MYAIIEYTKSGEVDYLPMKWIVDQLVLSDSNDIQQLISDRMPLDFYFPPMKASDKLLGQSINVATQKLTGQLMRPEFWLQQVSRNYFCYDT